MSESGEYIGHWLPHTSSIDFCEPDYFLSHYVAEPFNVLSSFFIAMLGLCGLLYSNPTQEGMFSVQFGVIVSIGLGSVLLHSTLQAFPQSLDEVPMMWFNVVSKVFSVLSRKDNAVCWCFYCDINVVVPRSNIVNVALFFDVTFMSLLDILIAMPTCLQFSVPTTSS